MRERQREVQLYRGQVPSPGRPTVAWRTDRVRFWAAIARGVTTEEAALEAGVSSPVVYRWFRHAGGVNPRLPPTVSGRYLSFSEREDIPPASPRSRPEGDRSPAGARSLDDLSGAAPQRFHTDLAARVQGVGRAVACRAPCPATQGRQAGQQRSAPGLRARPAVSGCQDVRWQSRRPARPGMEGQEQAPSGGSPLG